jgi:hypothetical protein
MKNVFIIWKDIEDNMWHTVAKLTRLEEGGYRFNYTKGASNKNFITLPRMKNLAKVYNSTSIFSFFSNRLIPANRPESKKMLEWSGMDVKGYDELDLLGISGGARKTDEFRIVAEPKATGFNEYKIRFFVSGISHLSSDGLERVEKLKEGEVLKFVYEDTNTHDCKAILVSSIDEVPIGYCPKYFNCDIRSLLENSRLTNHSLTVVKMNIDAPNQFKVLCEFVTGWPENFIPLVSEEYLAYSKNH